MLKYLQNILLITLTGLFFIINTGFTLTLHYCNMEKEIPISGCGMWVEPGENEVACSNEESSSNTVSVISIPQKCCEMTLGTIAGTDEYLLNKSESVVKSVQIVILPTLDEMGKYYSLTKTEFIFDTSPPEKTSVKLFLSNQNFRV